MTNDSPGSVDQQDDTEGYPLKDTTALLNDRLGLYLSEEQKRGFAAGLLIGTAAVGALVTWSIGEAIRKGAG